MNQEIKDKIEAAASKEEIYERKYGGKDHSGYDTMMLYEVNDERYDCFERGASFGYSLAQADLEAAKVEIEKLKPKHECEFVARAFMGEGRDWWLGKLTKQIPEWPQETHCLHIKTPIKDIVLLCNSGDFTNLSVLCRHALGYNIDETWMGSQLEMTKNNK